MKGHRTSGDCCFNHIIGEVSMPLTKALHEYDIDFTLELEIIRAQTLTIMPLAKGNNFSFLAVGLCI